MEDFFEERTKLNMFEKIQSWWSCDGKYYHKYFKNGVKNLWYWFPIIWKDRDWDSHYIFEVLKHKLKAQAQYIGDRDWHTRAQQDARRMRICVKLMQKVQDEEYVMEYMDYEKNRYGFIPCTNKSDYRKLEIENVWENHDEYFAKYPLIYKRVLKGEGVFTLDGRDESDIKHVIAQNIAHINQERAQNLLFKILNENINRWWD